MAAVSARGVLIDECIGRLELDHPHVEDVPAFDQDRIDPVRSCRRSLVTSRPARVRYLSFEEMRYSSGDAADLRCTVGEMPRTRLKAALSAKALA